MAALITLVTTAADNSIVLAYTAWATETVRPANLFKCCLTLRLGGIESVELWRRKTFLESDKVIGNDLIDTQVPL